MKHDIDMFEDSPIVPVDLDAPQRHLDSISDDDFERRYKVTKRMVRALAKTFPALRELHQALQEPTLMEIDYQIPDAVRFLNEDLSNLVEQMLMASYWDQEGANQSEGRWQLAGSMESEGGLRDHQ